LCWCSCASASAGASSKSGRGLWVVGLGLRRLRTAHCAASPPCARRLSAFVPSAPGFGLRRAAPCPWPLAGPAALAAVCAACVLCVVCRGGGARLRLRLSAFLFFGPLPPPQLGPPCPHFSLQWRPWLSLYRILDPHILPGLVPRAPRPRTRTHTPPSNMQVRLLQRCRRWLSTRPAQYVVVKPNT
jgi:hypothetical protein